MSKHNSLVPRTESDDTFGPYDRSDDPLGRPGVDTDGAGRVEVYVSRGVPASGTELDRNGKVVDNDPLERGRDHTTDVASNEPESSQENSPQSHDKGRLRRGITRALARTGLAIAGVTTGVMAVHVGANMLKSDTPAFEGSIGVDHTHTFVVNDMLGPELQNNPEAAPEAAKLVAQMQADIETKAKERAASLVDAYQKYDKSDHYAQVTLERDYDARHKVESYTITQNRLGDIKSVTFGVTPEGNLNLGDIETVVDARNSDIGNYNTMTTQSLKYKKEAGRWDYIGHTAAERTDSDARYNLDTQAFSATSIPALQKLVGDVNTWVGAL